MALSYEYSIGSVRAKEVSLLGKADIDRFIACQSSSQLALALGDKGYGSGKSVDEIIADHTEKTWEYIKSVAPDMSIFTPFILQNDVHNFKVVLKGTLADRGYDHLFVKPLTVETDTLVTAVEQRRHDLLPEWLSKSADEAYEILAHKGDARLSDAAVDRAVSEEMLRLSKKSGSGFLYEYFRTLVFYNSVKTAIRAARTNAGSEYLHKALPELEGFDRRAVISAALRGSSELLDELQKISEFGCGGAVEAYRESPSAFEKYVDNLLMKKTVECCRRASEGAEPLLGYYLACEAEKKALYIIDGGIRTGAGEQVIRERMRELYG